MICHKYQTVWMCHGELKIWIYEQKRQWWSILFAFVGDEFFEPGVVNKCIKLVFETCINHEFIRRPFTWLYLRVPWLVRIGLPNRETGTPLAWRTTMIVFPEHRPLSEIFSDSKEKWTRLNETHSNYSYKCLEAISCIKTTWDQLKLTCKAHQGSKNMQRIKH